MAGVPELLLLQLLSAREMYGYELARAVRLATGDTIQLGEGVLYPALHALERRSLVRARQRSVQGRTRIYYTATPAGRRRLLQLTREWRRISSAVDGALAGSSS